MILAVAGGKGGIGKTLIATSLALSNAPVQFLDCDVEEPNAHLFLEAKVKKVERVSITVPHFRKWKGEACYQGAEFCRYQALAVVKDTMLVFPELCVSCGGCFLLCPEGVLDPVDHQVGDVKTSKGRNGIEFISGELKIGSQRTTEVIRAVKNRLDAGGNAVVDCPPGSGRPVLESLRGSDFCLLVTEPTPFGLHDVKGNKRLLDILNIPGGVVINRAGGGYDGIRRWCEEEGVPVLEEIPFDLELARAAARGRTLPDIDPSWARRFQDLWAAIKRKI
ncbi:MAG: ATP-binding protein [PVC group bacterium]